MSSHLKEPLSGGTGAERLASHELEDLPTPLHQRKFSDVNLPERELERGAGGGTCGGSGQSGSGNNFPVSQLPFRYMRLSGVLTTGSNALPRHTRCTVDGSMYHMEYFTAAIFLTRYTIFSDSDLSEGASNFASAVRREGIVEELQGEPPHCLLPDGKIEEDPRVRNTWGRHRDPLR